MVSPISAISSRAPSVQALTRVAAIAPKADAAEQAGDASKAGASAATMALDPGAPEALPAGYRNLALPLGASGGKAQTAAAGAPAGESPLMAAYGPSEFSLASLPRLVDSRLPTQTLVQEVQAAVRERAEAKGQTPSEFLDSAPIVESAKLPSRNAPDSEATLRASLLVRDGERETAALDVYLTKTGPSSFEAVAYDRDFAAPAGGFPYSAPPLAFERVLFDPTYAAMVAVASGRAPVLGRMALNGRRMSLGRLFAAAGLATATLFAVALSLAAQRPLAAAAAAGVGFGALALAMHARPRV